MSDIVKKILLQSLAIVLISYIIISCDEGSTPTSTKTPGLGIKLVSIQVPFEKLGFIFEAPFTFNRQVHVNGFLPDLPMGLELIGKADNLSQVSFMGGMPTKLALNTSLIHMSLLCEIVLPDWNDSKVWLLENMRKLTKAIKMKKTPEESIVINNRKVSLSMLDTAAGIVIFFTIQAS